MKFLNAYLDYENKVINDLISKIKKVLKVKGKRHTTILKVTKRKMSF